MEGQKQTHMRTLWCTIVGSHAWSMDRPNSDFDIFSAYIVPSQDILSGKNKGGASHCSGESGGKDIDKVSHEIGKIIDELIKGNINFLAGVMSPVVLYRRKSYNDHKSYLDTLKDIVIKHGQTKSCVNSIRGLAVHNYTKYIRESNTVSDYSVTKKCNTINRVLLFGINIVNGKGFEFKPVKDQTPEDVLALLHEFDESVISSTLPENTDPEPFRRYLFELRMKELNGTI